MEQFGDGFTHLGLAIESGTGDCECLQQQVDGSDRFQGGLRDKTRDDIFDVVPLLTRPIPSSGLAPAGRAAGSWLGRVGEVRWGEDNCSVLGEIHRRADNGRRRIMPCHSSTHWTLDSVRDGMDGAAHSALK